MRLKYSFCARHHRSGPRAQRFALPKIWSPSRMGCVHGKSNERQREEGQAHQTQRATSASGHDDRAWRLLALSISSSQSTVTCTDSTPPTLCRKVNLPPCSATALPLASLCLQPGLTSTSSPHSSNPRPDADRVLPRNSSLRPNPHCQQRNSSLPSRSHREASNRGIPSSGEPSAVSTSSSSSSSGKLS